MPEKVLKQIQYLCRRINQVEWSGVLFYSVTGSIQKPKTFEVKLETILPLDMGSGSYTSYALDHRFIDFLEEDFDVRSKWKVGHIHSHHNMQVFFSGTDQGELHDNAPAHNFYLSLIVNNNMDFKAKIAFTAEGYTSIPKVPFYSLDEKGKKYSLTTIDYEVKETKLAIFNCEVKTPIEIIKVEDSFIEKVTEIMKPKLVVEQKTWYQKQEEEKQLRLWPKPDKEEKKIMAYNPFDEEDEDELDAEETLLYHVVKNILNYKGKFTPLELDEMCLEEVLHEIMSEHDSAYQTATAIVEKYPTVLAKLFPEITDENMIIITYDIIEIFDLEILSLYPELKLTVILLNKMVEKFIENGKQLSTSKI